MNYHVSESEAKNCSGKPRGFLFLAGAVIAPSIEDEYTFSVNPTNGEVYKLRGNINFATNFYWKQLYSTI